MKKPPVLDAIEYRLETIRDTLGEYMLMQNEHNVRAMGASDSGGIQDAVMEVGCEVSALMDAIDRNTDALTIGLQEISGAIRSLK